MIALRPEAAADEAFLRILYAATRSAEMASLPLSDLHQAQLIDQQFDAQRQHYRTHFPDADFRIITFDDKAVGRWYLHRDSEYFHLLDIALLPEYRNQGIGGGLLASLLQEATQHAKAVRLYVDNDNRAQTLYFRLGFSVIEQHPIHKLMEWRAKRAL